MKSEALKEEGIRTRPLAFPMGVWNSTRWSLAGEGLGDRACTKRQQTWRHGRMKGGDDMGLGMLQDNLNPNYQGRGWLREGWGRLGESAWC